MIGKISEEAQGNRWEQESGRKEGRKERMGITGKLEDLRIDCKRQD